MAIRQFEQKIPQVADSAYVDEAATVIGDVIIGADSSVWPGTVIRGDVHHIHIGKRTNIQDGTICHVTHYSEYNPDGYPLTIGDDVTIGHQCTIHACTIHSRSLIGMGSIVLDGAVVEEDAMIGAGSLIPPKKIIESGYLWLGSPVKRVRRLSAEEISFLKYSADHYVRLKNRY